MRPEDSSDIAHISSKESDRTNGLQQSIAPEPSHLAPLEVTNNHLRKAAPSSLGYSVEPKTAFKAALSSDLDRSWTYKRARTVSPATDGYSSDLEQGAVSTYSRSNSDLGEADSLEAPLPSHQQQQQSQPTPLRESISSADVAKMLPPDHAIAALMKGKSLSLDDQASRLAPRGDQLPSYQQAQATMQSPASSVKPSGQEQLNLIRPMKNRALHVGDAWYLIARGWYRRWSAACSGQLSDDDDDEANPVGPIDSTILLDEDAPPSQALLKASIMENVDYEMVPQEGWDLLTRWYGVNGPVFARTVVAGLQEGQESVEFYPPIIRLLRMVGANSSVTSQGVRSFSLSASSSLTQLKATAKEAFGLQPLPDVDLRFWFVPEPTDEEVRSGLVDIARTETEDIQVIDAGENKPDSYNPNVTLKSIGIDEIEVILAVETQSSGNWLSQSLAVPLPATTPQSTRNIFSQQNGDFFSNLQHNTGPVASTSESAGRVTRSQSAMDRTMGRSRGLRGLNNLGNTCFMNSALQCLSNTYELQQYFVSGAYRDELNTDNPLGMGGAIAESFGSLISNIWDGQGGSFWPREFKFALARFAPQFSGYAQHDSQELLAFLLDGLHEDLNRILKKPYIEAPDWEGGDERDLVAFAKRQWDIYKARNDSVIVDLFQGQYRSTLVCPECNKVSIKFDPFMYLTLPIPNKKLWKGHVYFVPLAADQPTVKFEVALPANSTLSQLRQKVSTQFGVDSRHLVCGEVWHNEVYKWMDDYESVSDIKMADFVYFWETAGPARLSTGIQRPSYRQHRSLEAAEASMNVGDEAYAVLPVYSTYSVSGTASSSKHTFVNRRYKVDSVGIPFFVTIPHREIGDPEAVRKAVLLGYSRFAQDKDAFAALSARTNGLARRETKGNIPLSEWEMVDETANSETAVELVTSIETPAEDMVTEIHEDGKAVMVPGTDERQDQHNTDSMIVVEASDAEYHDAGKPSESLPELTIRFGLSENGGGTPKSVNDSADHLMEELHDRHHRLSSLAKVDSVDSSSLDDNEQETPMIPPLVYSGGALFCSWSPDLNVDKILDAPSNRETWGEYESVIDVALQREESAGPTKPKSVSMEDCMDEFTKEEQLGEDDPWFCPSCKEFRQATKKFDLWKVPDILVVHLKRFSAGRSSRDKLNMMVDFPLEGLDLSQRVEGLKAVRRVQEEAEENGEELSESMLGSGILRPLEDNDDAVAIDAPIYDLYAVDNHFGGLGGGHYTAYAKSPADGQWYNFDDSSVRPVSDPNSVRTSSAYLLFYRRRTTRPIGGKSRQKFQDANQAKTGAVVESVFEHSHLSKVTTGDDETMSTGASASPLSSASDAPGWMHTFRSADPDSAPDWTGSGNSPASSLRAMTPASERNSLSP